MCVLSLLLHPLQPLLNPSTVGLFLAGDVSVLSHLDLKPVKLQLKSARVPRQPTTHLGRISFRLKHDLSPYWTINTKMIFVSVLVEFDNTRYNNSMCIYDDVILTKQDSNLVLYKQKGEYPVFDFLDNSAR